MNPCSRFMLAAAVLLPWVVSNSATAQNASAKTPAEAVHALDSSCQTNERTYNVHLLNQTSAAIEVAFSQVTSKTAAAPGWTSNTGVFTLCANQAPGASCGVDPCVVAPDRRPIVGHHGELSAKVCEGGQCQTINAPPDDVNPPPYYQIMGWTLSYQNRPGAKAARQYQLTPSIVTATEKSSK
jgi:hypothetical protein